MKQPPIIAETARKPSRFPLWLAIGANVAISLLCIPLYSVPPGAHIRPMGLAVLIHGVALGGLAALPMALFPIRQRGLCLWMTVLLSVTPLPLGSAIAQHAARVRGFTFAE